MTWLAAIAAFLYTKPTSWPTSTSLAFTSSAASIVNSKAPDSALTWTTTDQVRIVKAGSETRNCLLGTIGFQETGSPPDLIIHHRGDDRSNVLALEWKKDATCEVIRELRARLVRIKAAYYYELGVLVDSHDVYLRWCLVENIADRLNWDYVYVPEHQSLD